MAEVNAYKAAYEREKQARLLAESLLDEKTRFLYESVNVLQKTVDELEETQDKLIQSEKMASLGQLAAGVAHEINNPIGFSLSNLNTMTDYIKSIFELDSLVMANIESLGEHPLSKNYLESRIDNDVEFITEDIASLLKDSIKGLERVSDIVANLKKVSHIGEIDKSECDINELVEESIKVVWSELKYNMEVNTNFGTLPDYSCHGGELTQVLMNLFINASHACEPQGTLDITTSVQSVNNKQHIEIKVQDNGKGMSKDVLKKIFDPFFTTKAVGVGTGLGLSVSFGIIEKHGGMIDVDSVEGKGTTFVISLPI